MDKKKQYIIQIIISLIVCIVFGSLYIYGTMKNIYDGQNEIQGNDIVSKILRDINIGNVKTALKEIDELNKDNSIDVEIKNYFSDFVQAFNKSDSIFSSFVDTKKFIKNSYVLERYFSNDRQALYKASVIPYYLIKKYNSKQRQKKEISVYKEYMDRFVEGKPLNKENANVACLYFYARYDALDKDFTNLRNEMVEFLIKNKDSLGDNGKLPIQRDYLNQFMKNLNDNLKNKPTLFGKVKSFWRSPNKKAGFMKLLFDEKVMTPYQKENL